MIIFYVVMFLCYVPMVQCMDGNRADLLSVIHFNCRNIALSFMPLQYVDEDDLIEAVLKSPFRVEGHMKAYPLADIQFPECYKPRSKHADIFEHDYLFLPKFPERLRLRV